MNNKTLTDLLREELTSLEELPVYDLVCIAVNKIEEQDKQITELSKSLSDLIISTSEQCESW